MKIIVDTSVWSQFLRSGDPQESRSLSIFRSGIREKNIQILGIIRQELLSGIKEGKHHTKVFELLASFPYQLAESSDHTEAAKFFTICRKNGIQGSPIDFLICAQASRNRLPILTEDKDFQLYAKYIPISLVSFTEK